MVALDDYRTLGRSGLRVSPLCLGAMTFGEADETSFMHKVGSDEATAHAVLDRALEKGINFVDTADVYGVVAIERAARWPLRLRHEPRSP